MSFTPLSYESYSRGLYEYPDWANAVGWCIAASSMLFIPGVAIYTLLKLPGNCWKQVRNRKV